MKVGIVCPYSFDVPGGVQLHIRDLAEKLIDQGHTVGVLAPADDDTEVPPYLTSSGGAVAVPYNGSVARLSFGPGAASKTSKWLTEGDFDVVHIHEPLAPSVSLIALRQAQVPIVATFHSAQIRSRALLAASPLVRPGLERISARIAVSEDARRTVVDHLGGDAVIIPNGVYTQRFAAGEPDPQWQGGEHSPTIAFLGRLDEPRKGLKILTAAIEPVLKAHPSARFFIAGNGDVRAQEQALARFGDSVRVLGPISDAQKIALLSSVDLYIAPQTGGESFGIVLIEALSAGATVISSDLPAFRRVLDEGRSGFLFANGDSEDLAAVINEVLSDEVSRSARRNHARTDVLKYDWDVVTDKILDVYAMVSQAAEVPTTSRLPSLRKWLRFGR